VRGGEGGADGVARSGVAGLRLGPRRYARLVADAPS